MKKLRYSMLALFILCGCSKQTVTSGPPTIVVNEIPPIEVNLGTYELDNLKQYIIATDSSGKRLSDEQITLSGYIDTHVLSTFQIQIKATDSNNVSSTSSLSVKTVDTTAPTFVVAKNPILQYINTEMDYNVKNCGLKISDNFIFEEALINNTRIFNTVEQNKVGKYTVNYTTKDSSDNIAEFELEIEISDDIDVVADYLYQKTLELFRGSNDYFLYGRHDTNAYHTELLNFDEIINYNFSSQARESFIELCTQEGWLLIESDSYFLDWEKSGSMPIAHSVQLQRKDDLDEETNLFSYTVHVTYPTKEGNLVESETEFIVGIEDNAVKIFHFENPFINSDTFSEINEE